DDGRTLVVGAPRGEFTAGRVWVIDDTGPGWAARQTLVGSAAADGDAFGSSVDISADGAYIAAGAPLADFSGQVDAGLAYLFEEGAGVFAEIDQLDPAVFGTEAGARFGAAVAVEATAPPYAVVTEPGGNGGLGSFFVYDVLNSTLDLPNITVLQFGGDAPASGEGYQVSAEGDVAIVGQPNRGNSGVVSVLARTGTFTFDENVVVPTVPDDEPFTAGGDAVSIGSDGSAVIGFPLFDGIGDASPSGAANHVDRGRALVWSDAGDPSPVEAEILGATDAISDQFGLVVDVDGDRLAVSAPFDDEPASGSGVVSIFERAGEGAAWVFQGLVRPPQLEPLAHFGDSLDLFGDRLAVGESDRLGDQAEAGRVWVFERQPTGEWTRLGAAITAPGATGYDAFGASVAFVDRDRLIIGSPGRVVDAGGVFATAWDGAFWALPVQLTTGTPDSGDQVGWSVAAATGSSGTIAVAGAPGDDDAGIDAGAIYIWEDTGSGFGSLTPVQKIANDSDFNTGDSAGGAVATDGFRIAVGGLGDLTGGSAHTGHVFEVASPGSPNSWAKTWEFRGTLPVDIAIEPNDYVDIVGGTFALGRAGQGGQVGLFRYDGTTWPSLPDDQLIPAGTANGDRVGATVSLDGRTLVTGASGDDFLGENAGAAFDAADLPLVATWVGGFGSEFGNPFNWDIGVVPGANDTAIVPAGSGSILILASASVSALVVGSNSSVTVVDPNSLTITGSNGMRSTIAGQVINASPATLDIDTDLEITGTLLNEAGNTVNINATSSTIAITGVGSWINEGAINKNGTFDASIANGILWTSASTSVINANGGDLNFQNIVLENGIVNVAAGASVSHSDNGALNPGGTYRFEIIGDSGDPANFGQVNWDGLTSIRGTIQSASAGFVPAAGETYDVVTCSNNDCDGGLAGDVTPGFDVNLAPGAVQLIANTAEPSVDIDGAWAVVGVPAQQQVLVLRNLGGTWTDIQTIDGTGVTSFGETVALQMPYLAVGAPEVDTVRLYQLNPIGQGSFTPNATTPVLNGLAGSHYGAALDAADLTLVVGAPLDDSGSVDAGAARWYDFSTGSLLQSIGSIVGGERFGTAVAATPGDIWVGAPLNNTTAPDAGIVYRYGLGGDLLGSFQEAAVAANHRFGSSIDADFGRAVVGAAAWFDVTVVDVVAGSVTLSGGSTGYGNEVAIAGDTIVIHDEGFPQTFVYSDNGNDLTYAQTATIAGFSPGLASDGGTVVTSIDPVGAVTSGLDAAVFTPVPSFGAPGNKLLPDIGSAGDQFGRSVAIDGDDVVISAPAYDGFRRDQGALYYFSGGVLQQVIERLLGFGDAVAISDGVIVAATPTGVDIFVDPGSGYVGTASISIGAPPRVIRIDGDTLVLASPGDSGGEGFVRVYQGGPSGWSSDVEQVVTSTSPKAGTDRFGTGIAISGDRLVVGAPMTASFVAPPGESGYVEVWTRTGPSADFTYDFTIDRGVTDDFLGWSVATERDRIVAGSPTATGTALVYDETGAQVGPDLTGGDRFGYAMDVADGVLAIGDWTGATAAYHLLDDGTTALVGSNTPGDFEAGDASAGTDTVATSGGLVVRGHRLEDQNGRDAGAAYQYDVGLPAPTNKLPGLVESGTLGAAVDTDSDLLVVGAPLVSEGDGAVYVFRNDGSRWNLEATLPGLDMDSSEFGAAVAIDNDTVFVGAPLSTAAGTDAGAVFVYRQSSPGAWVETDVVTQDVADAQSLDRFGSALDATDSVLWVGAPEDDAAAADAGAVYRFNGSADLTAWGSPVDKLTASDATANDLFGFAVAVRGATGVVGAPNAGTVGEGQAYVLVRSGNSFTEQAVLTGSATDSGDAFGWDVATSGRTILVGAPDQDDGATIGAGAAYVFTGVGDSWAERLDLASPAPETAGRFGVAVDTIGDLAIVGAEGENGATGQAHVFERSGGTSWGVQGAPSTAGDGAAGDGYGAAVTISGFHLAVGAPGDGPDQEGAVYTGLPAHPGVADKLVVVADDDDQYGFSVDIDGDTAVIGVPDVTSGIPRGGGSAFVYVHDGTAWQFQQELLDPDFTLTDDGYGYDVAVSGDTIAVGSWSDGVHIWTRSGTTWTAQTKLTDGAPSERFGAAVDLDGALLAVGAPRGGIGGAVYTYEGAGASWTPEGALTPAGVAGGDEFGAALALSGDSLVVGSPFDDDANTNAGAAYVFERSGGAWLEGDTVPSGGGGLGDLFGSAVALDGSTLVVGAPGQNDAGFSGAGFAYFYDVDGPTATLAQTVGDPAGASNGAQFGTAVAVDDGLAVIGASNGGPAAGESFTFGFDGASWVSLDTFTAPDAAVPDGVFGDRFGTAVGISGNLVLVGAPGDDTRFGSSAGSAYAFDASSPPIDGRIVAPDAAPADLFGQSVDIHDDWMVVGARNGDGAVADSGSAYVFRRDQFTDEWAFVTELQASDGTTAAWFGLSVAIGGSRFEHDGDTGNMLVAVGSPDPFGGSDGAVYLYRYDFFTDDWVEVEKIDAPDGAVDFGFSVDLEQVVSAFRNGTYALVAGAPDFFGGGTGTAHLYTYRFTENPVFSETLTFVDDLVAPTPAANGQHGLAVAIDGDSIVVGEPGDAAGEAHVYRYSLSPPSVGIEQTLRQPAGDELTGDNFGRSVDIDGDLAVVSSLFDGSSGASAGAAYVFERSGVAWGAGDELVSAVTGSGDNYGLTSRVEDGVIAVSSFTGGLNDAGTVQIFRFDDSDGWITSELYEWQRGDGSTGMGAGLDLSEDGVLAAGAAEDDNAGGVDAGAVQVFDVFVPLPPGKVTSGDDIDLALFGWSVDVDGAWAIVGAPSGGAGGTGAAYVFRNVAGEWQFFQEIDDPNPIGPGDDFGHAVAVGGSWAAVVDRCDEVSVYSFAGGSWTLFADVTVTSPCASLFSVDVDGANDRLVLGEGRLGAATGEVRIFDITAVAGLVPNLVVEPANSTGSFYGRAVSIAGDYAFAGADRDPGTPGVANSGSVTVFERSGTTWNPIQVLEPPNGSTAGFFGSDVDTDGVRLIVGQVGASRAWIYEPSGGTWVDVAELVAPATGFQMGRTVAISGNLAVAGSTRAIVDGLWAGAAFVYARAGSDWVLGDSVSAADREFSDAFGWVVALDGLDLITGAPFDTNVDGVLGGGAYLFGLDPVENPTIDLSVAPSSPVVPLSVSTIELTDLPPTAFQGYGGEAADYSVTSIQTLDLRSDVVVGGEPTPVAGVTIGELGLAGTPVTDSQLGGILLAELPVAGGWAPVLAGTPFEGIPEQSLTLLDVYGLAGVQNIPIGDLGLGTTNLGSLSTYAVLLAGIPVNDLPLTDRQTDSLAAWCALAGDVGLDCVADFGADLTNPGANGQITLPVLSFAGVEVDGAALLSLDVAGVDLTGSPIGVTTLDDLNIGAVPLSSQPLVPTPALPSYLPATVGAPAQLGSVTLAELGGAAPLNALDPTDTTLGNAALSTLDLAATPTDSPLTQYLWSPPAVGAALLLGDTAVPQPVQDIEIAEIGLAAPLLSVPLDEFVLPSGRALGDYRVTELLADSTPFGASPFGASPFGASPFGASPFGASPFGASPFGASPFGASPFGASPFGASPFGASPFGASPFGASPFGASPFGASPFGASPFGASPFGASPFGASPFGASPFGASPFGASPFGASSLSSLGLNAPVTALPLDTMIVNGQALGDYTISSLAPTSLFFDLPLQAFIGDTSPLDCAAIDCRQPNGFTIGDAVDAGALDGALTLSDVQPGMYGMTLGDLVGDHPAFTQQALGAAIASVTLTLAQAEAAGLDLVEIPVQLLPEYQTVTIGETRLLFSGWRLIDLVGLNADFEQTDFDTALADWRSAEGTDPTTVGDLRARLDSALQPDELWVDTLSVSTLAQADPNLALADVWPLLTPLRLEHLQATAPTTPVTLTSAAANRTVADVDAAADLTLEGLLWGDVLASLQGFLVADLAPSFAGVTLGEFLRAAQPITDQQSELIDLSSIDLADYSDGPGVTYTVGLRLDDALRPHAVRLVAALPADSRYVDGSAELSGPGGPIGVAGALEPTKFGDTLIWNVANVQPGEQYQITFEARSPVVIGAVPITVTAQLGDLDVFATTDSSVEFTEALEPNDTITDPGVITLTPEQIVVSQISTAGDVDVFGVDLTAGDRLGGVLWNLPADYDLTIIGPASDLISPAQGRVVDVSGDAENATGASTAPADAGQIAVPDGFAVIARSTNRAEAPEVVDPIPIQQTGTYYLIVDGYNGAESDLPYALQALVVDSPVEAPVCVTRSFAFPPGAPGPLPAAIPATTNALLVTDLARLGAIHGPAQSAVVGTALDQFVTDLGTGPLGALGIEAAVVDVGADPSVAAAMAAWDAAPCEVGLANDVVSEIVGALGGYYEQADIEYVMMVGSDTVLPMARLADRTLLGNEQNYAGTFAAESDTALYASLAAGTFLSDDPFVDLAPNLGSGDGIYVPTRSIGRLVESPTQIIDQLATFVASDGLVRTDTGSVLGYDFLLDSAEQVADALDTETDADDPLVGPIPAADLDTSLIGSGWTALDMAAQFLPAGLAPGITSLSGHFSHQGAQSAFGSETDTNDAVFTGDAALTDFTGSLLFSVGCHSGLHAPEEILVNALGEDWAEVFTGGGALGYVGQSGFGYGEVDGILLTERLMQLYAERLNGNYSIGEALTWAKNDYFAERGIMSVYDEKSLQQAILYGVPFGVPDVAAPPPLPEPPPDTTPAVDPVTGVDTATFSFDFEFEQVTDANRGTVWEIDGRSFATSDNPLQPITTFDVTAEDADADGEPDTRLHGAVFRSGAGTLQGPVDPVYHSATIDLAENEPEPQPEGVVFPSTPLGISDHLTEFGPRDSLVVIPGRFEATETNGDGTQTLYDDMVVQTYYSTSDDWARPTVEQVQTTVTPLAPPSADSSLVVTADVNDDVSVEAVVVVLVEDPVVGQPATWRSFDLTDGGDGTWSGATLISTCADRVELAVQVVDSAGNVGVMSNKAANFGSGCDVEPPVQPPELTAEPDPSTLDPGGSGWHVADPVTIEVVSTISPLFYEVDGGGEQPLVGTSFEISGDGVHTYEVRDIDGVVVAPGVVSIDAGGPPITEIVSPPEGSVFETNDPTPIVFACADPSLVSCDGALPDGTPVVSGDPLPAAVGERPVARDEARIGAREHDRGRVVGLEHRSLGRR
ncbi:MAG: C25 family cysteine peptidase, partial [Ilumatobacter sp.]|uniref:C25 family cysteine peptidase n=1 Tax=Ilumatobacter sp. TaxID=1967498 RepID=UPI0026233684